MLPSAARPTQRGRHHSGRRPLGAAGLRVPPSERLPTRAVLSAESLSRVQLSATPWTVARQAALSLGRFRQGHWSGLPRPPSGYLPDSGIQPRSPALRANSLPSEPRGKLPGKPTTATLLRGFTWDSLVAQIVKNLLAMQKSWV